MIPRPGTARLAQARSSAPWTGSVRLLAVCIVALAAASCGGGEAARAPETTAVEPSVVGISGVVASDGPVLSVLTDPLPLASATGRCAVTVEPFVGEYPTRVSVSFEVRGVSRPFEGCDTEPRRVDVSLTEPIGDRLVEDLGGSKFRFVDGRWVGCDIVVVTCVLEPAACEGASLVKTIPNLDVPRGFSIHEVRCQEPWAVVDVDVAAGACPGSGDGAPSCEPHRWRRIYLRIEADAWQEFGGWPEAGCGPVQEWEPSFPTELCHDLPALG